MRNSLTRSALLFAAATGMISTAFAADIKWRKTYDQALTEGKKSNRLLMIDFYTEW